MTGEPIDHDAIEQAANSNMQGLTDALWRLGGKPTEAVLAINPSAPRMKFFRLMPPNFPGACPWADLDTAGAQGSDLIALVAYMLGCDRERAATWAADVLRRAPPPSPSVPSNTEFRSAFNTRSGGVGVPAHARRSGLTTRGDAA